MAAMVFLQRGSSLQHPTTIVRSVQWSRLTSGTTSSTRRFTQSRDRSFAEVPLQSVLICGPSGVGKGTLIERLLRECPETVSLSVSRTSRAPRPGEVNGVHYHFVSREDLEKDIATGPWRYLEHAEVHGNLYGTREDAVSSIHASGRICLLDLDMAGARQLKALQYPMKTVFILPPTLDDLEIRLRKRGTESPEQLQTRLANAQREIEYGRTPGNFDHLIVNDRFDRAYEDLMDRLEVWFPLHFAIKGGTKFFIDTTPKGSRIF